MICAQCGKILNDTTVSEDGYYFCNTICRYTWRQNGKPNPIGVTKNPVYHQHITEVDLDFRIDPPGFENREMMIRPSYWIAPKLFLDGKQQTSIKKKLLSRSREYRAVSNFGKDVVIRVQLKPLDMLPVMFIDGKEFQIARPLSAWEYIWICIPMILMFGGGAIGGLLGGIATYSNSILMRKLKHWFPRYLVTGATTMMTVILLIRFIGFINPFVANLTTASLTLDDQLKQAAIEINKSIPQMLDAETRLDSTNSIQTKTFSYYFTLINQSKERLDIEGLRKYLTPNLIHNMKTNEQVKYMRDNDVIMDYTYFDKNKVKLLEIRITPSDYK